MALLLVTQYYEQGQPKRKEIYLVHILVAGLGMRSRASHPVRTQNTSTCLCCSRPFFWSHQQLLRGAAPEGPVLMPCPSVLMPCPRTPWLGEALTCGCLDAQILAHAATPSRTRVRFNSGGEAHHTSVLTPCSFWASFPVSFFPRNKLSSTVMPWGNCQDSYSYGEKWKEKQREINSKVLQI